MGRTLMAIGALLLVVGAAIALFERFLPGIGRLPGDIIIRRGNFTFYFPIATSLLASIGLTLLFWLWQRLGR
ncbi:DUF2905 domain-containing protein [Symbiobacterium thermophilum]|uniref:DUF2905 domain-containing protein n=2 Tax=Symbiobacterium thermophilum TaxID=2734 RepID=Q67SZ2_SYMTH|nr:DUF2905 domain-containing protein [Symbiobacterium thermophilum]MBY6275768.1 DUF2905 domain-containing protein [Symbiobacterium thermophilum]OTA41497.1 MAG: hypothetical protein A6D92_06160 [Symbiobacterium thermophilum]BAD39201.1 conserved hypothetical protein [Symbiobacterium thermophilum IAM 14863]